MYTFAARFLIPALALSVAACSTGPFEHVGKPPALTPVEHPGAVNNYQPVVMPMPAPDTEDYASNSLWKSGARTFFKDQRARNIGDILTVEINITDSAQLNNTTTRSRSNDEDANLTNFLGFEGKLGAVLPDAVSPSSLVDFGSTSSNSGTGTVNRAETVALTVAAVVTQVLPNGNLVIAGRQEVRVNYEVRELLITGVVRPEDIANSNTIQHTQIAEARVSYGGRGHLSAVQQARYGQQIYDVLFPF